MIVYLRRAIVSSFCLTLGVTVELASNALAQIVPDSTLPSNSIVAPNGSGFAIDGGTTTGTNLFHSFSEFSVPTRTEALFNNASNVENILTRVTGGNISNIDGLIRANGGANLFLLNPNGIVFGANARLDLGGSFFGTTAKSIIFEDGLEFSASSPQEQQPLLTVSVPIGLQWGDRAGDIGTGDIGKITAKGPGNRLQISLASPTDRSLTLTGLAVAEGRTLALIGNNVTAEGGLIAASGGRVELAGVQQGRVLFSLADATFAYDGVSEFGDLLLDNQSLVDVSGIDSGSIGLQGRNIAIENLSALLSQNTGTEAGGEVRVTATAGLEAGQSGLGGFILSESIGPGQSSEVIVAAPRIVFRNGSAIASRTYGTGNSGNILVESENIALIGVSPLDLQVLTSFVSATFALGNASDIRINTARLTLAEGGVISSVSFGVGNGGNLEIAASEIIELAGQHPVSFAPSSISSTTLNRGNVGSTFIQTERLVVLSGAVLGSATFAAGNTGTTNIGANSIEVGGIGLDGEPSFIGSSALLLSVALQQLFGLPAQPSGRAGALTINTDSLTVIDRGIVGVFHEGTGDAGDFNLRANTARLDSSGRISAETVSGQGGNLVLGIGSLVQLRNGSQITVEAGGSGDGGNLTADAGTVALLEGSRITANAFEGNGGNISIATSGIFSSANSSITASSQFGVDGLISITNPSVDSTTGLVELSENPIAPNSLVVVGCAARGNSFVVTGRGGLPPSPEGQLTSDRPWTDLRDLSAFRGSVGKNISPGTLGRLEGAIVEANAVRVNERGEVELVAVLEGSQEAVNSQPPNCAATELGS